MSYAQNWFRHLVAPFTGEGGSRLLARDFWPGEDLWSTGAVAKRLWAKLLLVYAASVIAQVTAPLLIALAAIDLVKGVPLKWWFIVVGGGTILGVGLALLWATVDYVSVTRQRRGHDA